MSALNAFAYPDKALILTDGAVYNSANILLRVERKCFVVEGTSIAIASRGYAWFAPGVAKALAGHIDDIDDIEERGEEMIEACIEAAEPLFAKCPTPQPVNLVLAGWSTRDRCAKIFVYNNGVTDLDAVFSQQERIFSPNPLPDREADDLMRLYQSLPGRFEAVSHGIPLIEAQRRMVTTEKDGEPAGDSLIGGHVLATEITARGVTQKVIHTWRDRVGEKIRPAPQLDPVAHPNVTPIAGMNRAERRRMEKIHGKRVA